LGIHDCSLDTVHLMYSWTCAISDGDFVYQESAAGIDILQYTQGPSHLEFPYVNYPGFFPRRAVVLEPLSVDDQTLIQKVNRREGDPIELEAKYPRLAAPASQVGGEPRLMQWPVPVFDCPKCGAGMPLLAVAGHDNGSPLGMTGNQFVQVLFYFCSACAVVAAVNITD
jgi:hypothetical protein